MPNPTLKDQFLNLWFRNRLGADSYQQLSVPPNSRLRFGNQRQGVADPILHEIDTFPKLPVITTAVATSDQFFLVAGTNAANAGATQADKGGLKLATAGADNDQEFLAAASNNRFHPKITATSQIEFSAQVSVGQIGATSGFSSFGLNENVTAVDPAGTAGDGAMFLSDPANELTATTGATAAQAGNWILCYKVNGADTFAFTNVPIQAGIDVVLEVKIGTDLIADMYIDGVLVGSSPALTSGDSVKAFAGIQAGAAAAQFIEVRYIACGRQIG